MNRVQNYLGKSLAKTYIMSKNVWKSTKQWLERTLDFRNVLQSRLILYFLFILTLGNLYVFVSTGSGMYAAVLLIVGYLTTFYSKNMIVVMFVALVAANVLKYGSSVQHRDGFTADDETKDKDAKEHVEEKETGNEAKGNEAKGNESKGNEAKDKDTEKKKTTTDEDAVAATKEKIKMTKDALDKKDMDPKYKEEVKHILELQSKIMSSVTDMAPLLKEAQAAMATLKSNNIINQMLL